MSKARIYITRPLPEAAMRILEGAVERDGRHRGVPS